MTGSISVYAAGYPRFIAFPLGLATGVLCLLNLGLMWTQSFNDSAALRENARNLRKTARHAMISVAAFIAVGSGIGFAIGNDIVVLGTSVIGIVITYICFALGAKKAKAMASLCDQSNRNLLRPEPLSGQTASPSPISESRLFPKAPQLRPAQPAASRAAGQEQKRGKLGSTDTARVVQKRVHRIKLYAKLIVRALLAAQLSCVICEFPRAAACVHGRGGLVPRNVFESGYECPLPPPPLAISHLAPRRRV